jgi:DNA modification methylase
MPYNKIKINDKEKLEEFILQEKMKGVSDVEIGRKYGVNYKYIEKIITKLKGINVSDFKLKKIVTTYSPKDFREEGTTLWSFRKRGNWATHNGKYRGNWSPFIPRNIILKYSKPGDIVLDFFVGGGTTAIEAKLLGRRCIARDINPVAIELARENLNFNIPNLMFEDEGIYEPDLHVGDARNLSDILNNSIDLICTHPPYAGIINYSSIIEEDLSRLNIEDFVREIEKVAKESYRVLKPSGKCAILVGDSRKNKHVIPIGFKTLDIFLKAGFELKELIIKRQHNCKTTGFWYEKSIKYNFLLLAHEYLLVFTKPSKSKNYLKVSEVNNNIKIITEKYKNLAGKLEKPETTTVWILPANDFEDRLNGNVINRYSKGDKYEIISFFPYYKNSEFFIRDKNQKGYKLLFIKFPFLSNNVSFSNIEYYLKEIKEFVSKEIINIIKDGFLVIQTKDIRIGKYIEPFAKRMVDLLTFDNIWLKEIIVVVRDKENSETNNKSKYLRIIHHYLLVFKKVK